MSLWTSIVFPHPGRPVISRLCFPATAISIARISLFGNSSPSISSPSSSLNKTDSADSSFISNAFPKHVTSFSAETASSKDSTPATLRPCTEQASSKFAFGTIAYWMPEAKAVLQAACIPLTALTLPDNSSSPITRTFSSINPESSFAFNIPRATGRSNPAPSFLRSAGERLIKTLSAGNSNPLLIRAERTLSLVSFTAPSARPTTSTAGIPLLRSTSTLTRLPSYPNGENE